MREKPFYKRSLFWACVASILLLALFLALQAAHSPLVSLPVQWVWLSVLPILLALILGGYITKLKAPGFEFEGGLENLAYFPRPLSQAQTSTPGTALRESAGGDGGPPKWTEERGEEREEYKRRGGLFLVHLYKVSTRPGQRYDVTIFLLRHVPGPAPNQKEAFGDVQKAEFYFGESWGHQVFSASNEGGFIGVSTSAWGTFLATCRVTFRNPESKPAILHRYVDFEMAPQKA